MKKATAVLVEDEPLALSELRDLVSEIEWLETVGEAPDGAAAVRLIEDLRPDIVFLDVQLPELSGLEVLDRVVHQPVVVFTTAHDRYAVAAFELEALDYLIKPFGRERFRRAISRARRALRAADRPATAERARRAFAGDALSRILVRHRDGIVPIALDAIERLEARGDYVALHTRGRRFLVRLPMSELERRLDPARFLRVHRSHIVNMDHVKSIAPYDGSRFQFVMRDGTELMSSRARAKELRRVVL
ncbi:MAG: LytR/AlgR family response regulator transcription factor [Gemmatimonadota bacterium]